MGLISRDDPLHFYQYLGNDVTILTMRHHIYFCFFVQGCMYNKCNHLADSGPCVGRNHLGEAITREKKLSGLLTYPAITRTRPDELLNQKKGDTFKMFTAMSTPQASFACVSVT